MGTRDAPPSLAEDGTWRRQGREPSLSGYAGLSVTRNVTALGVAALAVIVTGGSAVRANPWLKEPGTLELIGSATITRQQAGQAAGATANAFFDLHIEYGAWQEATVIAD